MNRLPGWQAALMRVAGRLVSPGGRRGSLLVLMFHRVLPEPDPMLPDEPDAATFAAQMDLVKDLCNVIGLPEAAERIRTNSLPPRAAAITFDDGYANNLQVAAPILKARGLTASFFIATGFTGGGCMFNDIVLEALRTAPTELDLTELGLGRHELPDAASRRRAMSEILPRLKYFAPGDRSGAAERLAEKVGLREMPRLMMDEGQVRSLAELGMDVGGHTVSHPILSRLSREQARREIEGCKHGLEDMTGRPVSGFAYPNGRPGQDYGPDHVRMVAEAGFRVAVSTAWGAATAAVHPLQLPRIAPWDRRATLYGLRLVRSYSQRTSAEA